MTTSRLAAPNASEVLRRHDALDYCVCVIFNDGNDGCLLVFVLELVIDVDDIGDCICLLLLRLV